MLLVCLNVLPEGDLAVGIEVQLPVEDELRGALGTGDSSFEWKHVAPEDGPIDQLDNHHWRKVWEWKNSVLGAHPFLDGTVETLNVWDMLVTSADAEDGAKVGDVSPHRFKLVIGKDYGNAEPP